MSIQNNSRLELSVSGMLQIACASLVTFLVYTAIYRLYLSPLARFPGPKLAALTGAYEGYYECLKDGGGRYYVEINKMHDRYGPIVRINPGELHVRDPEWNELYKVTRRVNKPIWFYCFLGSTGNTFGTDPWELHRTRREALQSYFTAAAVSRYHGSLEDLVEKLLQRLRVLRGEIVRLDHAFHCLATDSATGFAFGRPFGHLDSPDFEHTANEAVRKFATLGLINRQLGGWLLPALRRIPPAVSSRISPASGGVQGFFKQLAVVIDEELHKGKPPTEDVDSIIQQILRANLPPEEREPWRVAKECSSVTLAGTETTGSLMSAASFLVLSHPEKLNVLKTEISEAESRAGKKLSYSQLKELPYLTGVINEALRLHTLSARLPRYDPVRDMVYNEWVIPKGTTVSMTQNDVHFHEDIFPEPRSFQPERWTDLTERKRLSKYLQPWGRGKRMCLGIDLATAEIYLALGRLFSPTADINLDLYDTNYEEDVETYHDYFSSFPKSLKGIRVLVS